MGFSLEYEDLEEQYESLIKIDKSFDNFLKDFLIEMAERVIKRTKKRTPVDTGDLRRAWVLGDIHGKGNSLEVEILNGMEYATEIEYGHRVMGGSKGNKVELYFMGGHFMLSISIDEIRKQMPLRWQKEFKQFCMKKGLKYD